MANLRTSDETAATLPLAGTELVRLAVTPNNFKATTLDVATTLTSGPTAFTPNDGSGAGLPITNNGSAYYRIGKLFVCQIDITYPTTANGATASIGNLPFTFNNVGSNNFGGVVNHSDASGSVLNWGSINGAAQIEFFADNGSGLFTNANLTTLRLFFSVIGFSA